MVLQPGADNLLAVVQVFGADEAHHGVDQQRRERARHRVGTRLHGLLVDAMMRVGRQRAALPGLEIHHVVAHGAASQRLRGVVRLGQQRQADAEGRIGALAAGHRLEHQIHRRALPDRAQGIGDVGQHAGLRGDVEAAAQLVDHAQQRDNGAQVVRSRVDADGGIAAAIEQPVDDRRGNALGIVGRVVGLQPHREPARQPHRAAKARHHLALARHRHQVLVAHQLADRGGHLRGDARRHPRQHGAVGFMQQQPVAQVAHGSGADGGKGRAIVPVQDQARDLVVLVRHQRLGQELLERHLGQRQPRGHPLLLAGRGNARQRVAGTRRAGPGQ
ncbi:hypothetical protein D3C72_1436430 [compost metagenome]